MIMGTRLKKNTGGETITDRKENYKAFSKMIGQSYLFKVTLSCFYYKMNSYQFLFIYSFGDIPYFSLKELEKCDRFVYPTAYATSDIVIFLF